MMEDEEDLFNDETLRKTLMGKKKKSHKNNYFFSCIKLNINRIGYLWYN